MRYRPSSSNPRNITLSLLCWEYYRRLLPLTALRWVLYRTEACLAGPCLLFSWDTRKGGSRLYWSYRAESCHAKLRIPITHLCSPCPQSHPKRKESGKKKKD